MIRPQVGNFTIVKTSVMHAGKVGYVKEANKVGCAVQYPGGQVAKFNWDTNQFVVIVSGRDPKASLDDVLAELQHAEDYVRAHDSMPMELQVLIEYLNLFNRVNQLKDQCKINVNDFVNGKQLPKIGFADIESLTLVCNLVRTVVPDRINQLIAQYSLDADLVNRYIQS